MHRIVSELLTETQLQGLADTLDLDNSDIEDDLLMRGNDLDEELDLDCQITDLRKSRGWKLKQKMMSNQEANEGVYNLFLTKDVGGNAIWWNS